MNSYVGLESIQASDIFGNIVMAHMGDDWGDRRMKRKPHGYIAGKFHFRTAAVAANRRMAPIPIG